MSLMYKMFGKPRTIEDLARQAVNSGGNRANLEVRECFDGGSFYPHYEVFFRAGETERVISKHYSLASIAYAKALLYSVMFARLIREKGLRVTIDGESTDRAVRKARELIQKSKKLSVLL